MQKQARRLACFFYRAGCTSEKYIHHKGETRVPDDHQLLERFRFGDEIAFQELIEKYYRQVQTFSRQMGLASSALVHVMNEAFLEAYRNGSSWTGKTFRTRLFQKVHTLVIDQLSTHEKTEQQYDQKEIGAWFQTAQGTFTSEKASFLLHDLHDFSIEQTGEILHIDNEETKQAREKFLAQLSKHGRKTGEARARWKETFAALPDEVTPQEIWSYIQKARKQRRIKIAQFIAVGGTLSILSLGIFLLISPSVLIPDEKGPEPAPMEMEETEEGINS